jgi:hypothetical protein
MQIVASYYESAFSARSHRCNAMMACGVRCPESSILLTKSAASKKVQKQAARIMRVLNRSPAPQKGGARPTVSVNKPDINVSSELPR